MPTMGRLIGAILFGALAWYTTSLITPLFPEGTNLGYFRELNTAFGVFAGWTIAGSRAGSGFSNAVSYGLTSMVAMVVMALFFNSSVVMVERSLRRRYDGPGEAITDVFQLFMEHGTMMMTAEIIGTLLVGCLVAAFIVEAVGRRFS